jgi:hypothetical protein
MPFTHTGRNGNDANQKAAGTAFKTGFAIPVQTASNFLQFFFFLGSLNFVPF